LTTIRPAGTDDLADMSALLEKLFQLEADFSFDRTRQLSGLDLLVSRPGARLLVAESGGRAIGMCSGQLVISTAQGGPSAWVEDVVVEPDRRGRGVGKKLIEAVTLWAREQGASRLQLLADRDNQSALDFYDRLGWQQTRLICLRKQ
jgi:GNAT superfamily N-acetyltransferase